jgi:hypothetical protein
MPVRGKNISTLHRHSFGSTRSLWKFTERIINTRVVAFKSDAFELRSVALFVVSGIDC